MSTWSADCQKHCDTLKPDIFLIFNEGDTTTERTRQYSDSSHKGKKSLNQGESRNPVHTRLRFPNASNAHKTTPVRHPPRWNRDTSEKSWSSSQPPSSKKQENTVPSTLHTPVTSNRTLDHPHYLTWYTSSASRWEKYTSRSSIYLRVLKPASCQTYLKSSASKCPDIRRP